MKNNKTTKTFNIWRDGLGSGDFSSFTINI